MDWESYKKKYKKAPICRKCKKEKTPTFSIGWEFDKWVCFYCNSQPKISRMGKKKNNKPGTE